MKLKVRMKLFLGFGIVLILFVGVAITNTIFQGLVETSSQKLAMTQGDGGMVDTLKFKIMKADDLGAYYLLSTTKQEADNYLSQTEAAMTDVVNSITTMKQNVTDTEVTGILDATLAEFNKYAEINHQSYQVFASSIQVGPDGQTLIEDAQGVRQAQTIYFTATLDPTLNNLTKYTEWINTKTEQGLANKKALQSTASMLNYGLTGLAVLLGALIAFYFSNIIVKSVRILQKASTNIAEGNLTEEVVITSKDEFGELSATFNKMREDLRTIVKEVIETADNLCATGEELSAASEEATASSQEVSATIAQLAVGASSQANSVQETGSVIQQLASSSEHVAANAESVNKSSEHGSQIATTGVQQVENAVNKMESIKEVTSQIADVVTELGTQSQEIGQIVDVIKGIADQTNLLALNAAIEAARAGDQGRGFAVVAEEVRKLAEQSSISAAQIAELIGNIQRESERAVEVMDKSTSEVTAGVEAVHSAGQAFEKIATEINTIAKQIQEVSVASNQMVSGTTKAVQSVEHIGNIADQNAGIAQQVASSSEEQAATMESVSQSAQHLANLGENLTKLVSKFNV